MKGIHCEKQLWVFAALEIFHKLYELYKKKHPHQLRWDFGDCNARKRMHSYSSFSDTCVHVDSIPFADVIYQSHAVYISHSH